MKSVITYDKEQKFLIADDEAQFNDLLNDGWYVISVTAQHVAMGDGGNIFIRGKFAVVLERLV